MLHCATCALYCTKCLTPLPYGHVCLRWLTTYASGRRGVGMPKAVALEILDAYNNQGNIIKKRDDTHKMAQANKAFAHYAW